MEIWSLKNDLSHQNSVSKLCRLNFILTLERIFFNIFQTFINEITSHCRAFD